MKKRLALTILITIIGSVLGFQLTRVSIYGWFSSKWQAIENTPERVSSLVALERDSLWVQGESGVFHQHEGSSSCVSDCWLEVQEIPELPSIEFYESTVKDEACVPAPLLLGVSSKISECRREMWVDRSYIFALRKDGSIYFWQSDVYGEWVVVELFFGLCGGAIILFVPSLIFILLPGFIKWLSKRKHKKTGR